MLVQLNITDFAIIKHLEITLKPGLNILSGETGAGKSIIINAVNLILGGRASGDLIRTGCKEARVEALFSFPANSLIHKTLSGLGIPFEGELLIRRTISREGRNRVHINSSLATLQTLAQLGPMLISISGQHEHQLLLRPENHIYLLDDFGGLSGEREELGAVFNRVQSLKEEIRKIEERLRQSEERQELARFQAQEIERAELSPGEDESLTAEKKRLRNAEELISMVSDAYQILYERPDSVFTAVSQCQKGMERAAEIDPALVPVKEALSEIQVRVEDVSFGLRDFRKDIRIDPQRLEEVEERLELINRLKRKYGPTLEDVFRFHEELASGVHTLEEERRARDKLLEELQRFSSLLASMAEQLSKKRKEKAKDLEKAITRELRLLQMENTRFAVRFDEESPRSGKMSGEKFDGIRADGIDRVEFMISPNVGEELRPLSKIASGGELSRIMLALKTILARSASVETVVFDEVDSGISGATAEVVGEKLLSLSGYHQIICITHLPQIASQGETHFLVKKEVVDGRTQALICELEPESRVQEIARLLGGREITPSAVAHAKEMLDQ